MALRDVPVLWRKYITDGAYRYRTNKISRFLRESQWWPQRKIEAYQAERLQAIVLYAAAYVPFYRSMFKKIKISPADIKTARDLSRIPVLTREMVKRNFSALISEKFSEQELAQCRKVYTSGSTGTPTHVLQDGNCWRMRNLFYDWGLTLAGLDHYTRSLYFWSRPFFEKNLEKHFFHESSKGRLSLSTIKINQERLIDYLVRIKKFRPVFVRGAPSFLCLLANAAQERGIRIRFSVFISMYENLFSFQRRLIAECFGCRVHNYYTSEEGLINAIECARQEGMHVDIRQGILETVDETGKPVRSGNPGRVVSTGLDNRVMPLIRYELGDNATLATTACSCGRGLPLLKSLDGRASEMLTYQNKSILPSTLSLILERIPHIRECQFVQNSGVVVKVVRGPGYTEHDTKLLQQGLQQLVGVDFDPEIQYVSSISRTSLGKFQLVLKNLPKLDVGRDE